MSHSALCLLNACQIYEDDVQSKHKVNKKSYREMGS